MPVVIEPIAPESPNSDLSPGAPRIDIGLINNMRDGGFEATERRFEKLLEDAAGDVPVFLHLYTLPAIDRLEHAPERAHNNYGSLDALFGASVDALIVTGTEPHGADPQDEPYWSSLTKVIDWAERNTISTIFSCLAAHAAVLHRDGILRYRLARKCSGVFEEAISSDHPLTLGISQVSIPHSRWNNLHEDDLLDAGYSILMKSTEAGVGAFAKHSQSLSIFFQSHPEYDADTLLREYRCDIRRYLRGEYPTYPDAPVNYFDESTSRLAELSRDHVSSAVDPTTVISDCAFLDVEPFLRNSWRSAGVRIYRNWLRYMLGVKQQRLELANTRARQSTALHQAAPRTPAERALADIWSAVLHVEQVGIHDEFFELGGDSILGIQVIARAKKAGLRLTLKHIFEHQTIVDLASAAETVTQPDIEQGLITGEVPLTPIQKWFFEQAFADQHHWNHATLLELRQDVDSALLEKAIRQLVLHHDALRLRFQRSDFGWTQFNAGGEETVKLTLVDLAGTLAEKQIPAMETVAAELQSYLNLSHGPLINAALFNFGNQGPSCLLLVIHQLAVDGVSWRILLEDLQVLCEQLRSGGIARLPDKTLSFRKWAQELAEHARSATLEHEVDYWLAVSSTKSGPIPVDFSGRENTEASVSIVSVSLDPDETSALLQKVPHAYNTQIDDVLLASLGLALTSWIGQPRVRINLEGHGREELAEGIDLTRTVGWFATMFPVDLDLGGTKGPGEVLKSIKEQLRRIPRRGIGYGILRYLRGDESLAAQLRSSSEPEIAFNYLGQFDQTTLAFPFVLKRPIWPTRSPRAQRSHLLSINSLVTNGRLRVDWGYSEGVHRRSTIEHVAQNFIEALRSLIHHCTSASAGGYTPSDFVDAGLDQQELDSLIAELEI